MKDNWEKLRFLVRHAFFHPPKTLVLAECLNHSTVFCVCVFEDLFDFVLEGACVCRSHRASVVILTLMGGVVLCVCAPSVPTTISPISSEIGNSQCQASSPHSQILERLAILFSATWTLMLIDRRWNPTRMSRPFGRLSSQKKN